MCILVLLLDMADDLKNGRIEKLLPSALSEEGNWKVSTFKRNCPIEVYSKRYTFLNLVSLIGMRRAALSILSSGDLPH